MPVYEFNAWDYADFLGLARVDSPGRDTGATPRTTPQPTPQPVTLSPRARGFAVAVTDGPGPFSMLARDLAVDGVTYCKETRISVERVFTTRRGPARTLVIGHLCAPGMPPRRLVFGAADLRPGDRLDLAAAERAGTAGDGLNGFARGTWIETPHGAMAVEDLDPGDEVLTRDGGIQLVSGCHRQRFGALELVLCPQLRPVRIMVGALTGGRPGQDLLVTQGHRLVVDDWRAALLFGEDEILVPAKSLLNKRNVIVDCPLAGVEYYVLSTEASGLVCANGVWSESAQPAAGASTLPGRGDAGQHPQPGRDRRHLPALPALSRASAPSIAA